MKNCGKILAFSYLMNIFDLVATLLLVMKFGLDIEGNPFGKIIISHPLLTFSYKIFGIAALLFILYCFRDRKLAVVGAYTVFSVYSLLSVYHVLIMMAIA